MKQTITCALIALAASAALPLMAANPPPAAAPPPPPPAAAPAAAVTITYCYRSGEDFANCATSWEQMIANGSKLDGVKTAWEASGFESMVAALRYEGEDSTWCEPASGDTTVDDSFKAVDKYLKDNPDRVKNTAPSTLIDKALHEAYPCTKKGSH